MRREKQNKDYFFLVKCKIVAKPKQKKRETNYHRKRLPSIHRIKHLIRFAEKINKI